MRNKSRKILTLRRYTRRIITAYIHQEFMVLQWIESSRHVNFISFFFVKILTGQNIVERHRCAVVREESLLRRMRKGAYVLKHELNLQSNREVYTMVHFHQNLSNWHLGTKKSK